MTDRTDAEERRELRQVVSGYGFGSESLLPAFDRMEAELAEAKDELAAEYQAHAKGCTPNAERLERQLAEAHAALRTLRVAALRAVRRYDNQPSRDTTGLARAMAADLRAAMLLDEAREWDEDEAENRAEALAWAERDTNVEEGGR